MASIAALPVPNKYRTFKAGPICSRLSPPSLRSVECGIDMSRYYSDALQRLEFREYVLVVSG